MMPVLSLMWVACMYPTKGSFTTRFMGASVVCRVGVYMPIRWSDVFMGLRYNAGYIQ